MIINNGVKVGQKFKDKDGAEFTCVREVKYLPNYKEEIPLFVRSGTVAPDYIMLLTRHGDAPRFIALSEPPSQVKAEPTFDPKTFAGDTEVVSNPAHHDRKKKR